MDLRDAVEEWCAGFAGFFGNDAKVFVGGLNCECLSCFRNLLRAVC